MARSVRTGLLVFKVHWSDSEEIVHRDPDLDCFVRSFQTVPIRAHAAKI